MSATLTSPPDAFTRILMVNGRPVETDSEGYLRHLGDWSEDFVLALAAQEELTLTE